MAAPRSGYFSSISYAEPSVKLSFNVWILFFHPRANEAPDWSVKLEGGKSGAAQRLRAERSCWKTASLQRGADTEKERVGARSVGVMEMKLDVTEEDEEEKPRGGDEDDDGGARMTDGGGASSRSRSK